jgi:integrase
MLLDRPVRYKLLEDRNKVILSLLIYQGLSPQNIINLKTDDVDIDRGTIYIKATKKLKRRELELKPKQVILLYHYINESRQKLNIYGSKKLFIGKLGTDLTVDGPNRIIRPLQSLFPSKNLNPQTIRQSVITNWLNVQNISLEDVQLLSGQKWMSSTERYVKPNMDERREVINAYFPL